MDVRVVTGAGLRRRTVDDLPGLLADPACLVWVDVPVCDVLGSTVLREVFGFDSQAVRQCEQRNPVPKVHVYDDHVFVVLHAPEAGANGHVHYVELDQFIGPNYFVTVHGPVNDAVTPQAAELETGTVAARIESGALRTGTPLELSFAVVSALAKRIRDYLAVLTREAWALEQQVTAGEMGDPEQFLDAMFRVRHGLLALRTMATLSREVYGRMETLAVFGAGPAQDLVADLVDQFQRVAVMADGQKEYLQGVIEFYQTRTNTKMTIAAERLAVIAAVTLPITALSSVLGMNVIVNNSTNYASLTVLLVIMAVMSVALLIWSKRRGWW